MKRAQVISTLRLTQSILVQAEKGQVSTADYKQCRAEVEELLEYFATLNGKVGRPAGTLEQKKKRLKYLENRQKMAMSEDDRFREAKTIRRLRREIANIRDGLEK